MVEEKQPRFDAPIPGMSLTHELGARPWQQPAQFTTVEEVVDHYTTRMMNNDEFSEQLIDVMEMGIPLTTIANTIQLAGVMEGKHSVDTGLLALPVLIETMMLIGDGADVKYNTGMEDAPKSSSETMARRNVEKLFQEDISKEKIDNKEMADSPVEDDMETVEENTEKEEPMGLMQRRG
tara:strand:+ start:1664 stop:2200 length:537 start_codon:yes stop_codon:yes gene_type:complete